MQSRETGDRWASLCDNFVSFNVNSSPVVVYTAAGYHVCDTFARKVYGVPEATWLRLMADARRQPGGSTLARQMRFAHQATTGIDKMGGITSTSEAINWWKDLMREWDMLPNESPPVIKYPSYVAEALYKEVYLLEMEMYSLAPPLKQRDGKAPGSWLAARTSALIQFSLDKFGLKSGSTTGDPRLLFRLVERANHSNFPECNECRANRIEKENNIRLRRPREARDATSAKQVAHVHECHAERDVSSGWVREANRSNTQLAQLDDKLGSWWNFLPMPPNGRFSKATSGKWTYHQCVMANLFPGTGNFYSFVPPFLVTGNNFGCTAFCVSLCRLIRSGKVPATVTTLFRQTDSGSDVDGKTTHGLHYVLVREGACNQLQWGRLRTGHSHNWCDFTFAEAKTIFYPRNGVGPGCASPMEYHAALVDGFKKLAGGLEIMWHLANFDFDKFVGSFVDRAEFTQAQAERLWRYDYAPELKDLYVRCTYKTKLNDVATAIKAEWKPHLPPNEAGVHPQRHGLLHSHHPSCHHPSQVGMRLIQRVSSS